MSSTNLIHTHTRTELFVFPSVSTCWKPRDSEHSGVEPGTLQSVVTKPLAPSPPQRPWAFPFTNGLPEYFPNQQCKYTVAPIPDFPLVKKCPKLPHRKSPDIRFLPKTIWRCEDSALPPPPQKPACSSGCIILLTVRRESSERIAEALSHTAPGHAPWSSMRAHIPGPGGDHWRGVIGEYQ